MKKTTYTVREVSDLFGCQPHHVRRLFSRGVIPEPDRFNGVRAIPKRLLRRIHQELVRRGKILPG